MTRQKGRTHGNSGYAGGCRCEVCAMGHRVTQSKSRQKRLDALKAGTITIPGDKHGSVSTYTGWGCRCKACTRAMATYNMHRYDRLKDERQAEKK